MANTIGNLTDRSVAITTGGTAQDAAPALPYRRYILIQNQSSTDIYVNFEVTAVADSPSIRIAGGASLEFNLAMGVIPDGRISVIGATTGQKVVVKEA